MYNYHIKLVWWDIEMKLSARNKFIGYCPFLHTILLTTCQSLFDTIPFTYAFFLFLRKVVPIITAANDININPLSFPVVGSLPVPLSFSVDSSFLILSFIVRFFFSVFNYWILIYQRIWNFTRISYAVIILYFIINIRLYYFFY